MKTYQCLMRRLLFLLIMIILVKTSFSQAIFIGPTYHYNIGGGTKNSSFGLEISYWNWEAFKDFVPLGFDWGFEFEKGKSRIYTEIQAGILVGGSIGYVHEFTPEYNKGGFQGSAWGAIFGGVELRYRRINNTHFFSPGVFIKAPVTKKEPPLC